jgi:hypothetical protein
MMEILKWVCDDNLVQELAKILRIIKIIVFSCKTNFLGRVFLMSGGRSDISLRRAQIEEEKLVLECRQNTNPDDISLMFKTHS